MAKVEEVYYGSIMGALSVGWQQLDNMGNVQLTVDNGQLTMDDGETSDELRIENQNLKNVPKRTRISRPDEGRGLG